MTDPDMLVPEGKTCDDCAWSPRCKGLLGSSYDGNVLRHQCDWAPSRFRQASPEQILANKPVPVAPDITADTPVTLSMDVELAITVGYDEPHYRALLDRVKEAEQDQKRYRTLRRLQTSDDLLCDVGVTACESCPVARFCGADNTEVPDDDQEVDMIADFLEGRNLTVKADRGEDREGQL